MEWLYRSTKGYFSGLIVSVDKCFKERNKQVSSVRGIPHAGLALALTLPMTGVAAPDNAVSPGKPVTFNTAFIQGSEQPPDLNQFLQGNSVVAGIYRVDVYVNRTLSGRRDITFSKNPVSGRVEPCLTLEMLQGFGLDSQRLSDGRQEPATACFDLPAHVEFARVDYQPSNLRLSISVPQIVMSRSSRGFVSPDLWDEGETMAFANYNFTGTRRTQSNLTTDQYYLGLRNGVNLGAWRLRNESSMTYGDRSPYRFSSNQTYAQRDLTTLKGQLTLGETFTDSQVFDSVRFQGAAITSDDGMLPDNQRIYAPTIRGIAESNATVEVRQNGFMLYSGNVSPGPFEISDIYPSGSNGDLLVTVIEADGRRRSFTQAYAALPIMVPQGSFRYSVATGRVANNGAGQSSPVFGSAALIYGLSERITGYGGLQLAEDYRAANLGLGVNTGLGAVSADITQSTSESRNMTRNGQSLRLRYANTLDVTNTTLAIAGYRYSTEQYLSLSDHVAEQPVGVAGTPIGRARDRFELSVTQALPAQSGSFSLTASQQHYWNLPGQTRQFYLSYNAVWHSLSYSISLERSQQLSFDGQGASDNQVSLNLNLPLGSSSKSSRLSMSVLHDSSGGLNTQVGLNGQVLDDRNTFYSVQAGHDSGSGSFGLGKLNTTQPYGRFEVGYSQGRDYDAFSLGANGSMVVHGGGINLGQSLGETFALVQVPGVGGAKLTSFSNVETSDNGYAILPYTQPYRTNWISLDTRLLGADIDVDQAIAQVVPRRGAMPLVRFKAAVGRRVQFELVRGDGSKIPLGATVEDAVGKALAVVDPSSRALVLSDQDQGVLNVKWADQHCEAAFSLPERDANRAYERLKVICQ